MASRNWIETIFGARRPVSTRPRRERDDWYIPLEIGRLEERRVLNVAPVLAGANNLATVHQNQPATTNSGTQVAALIAGKVTDADPGALSGIAVTAVNNTNGTWQYSTDSGSNWTSVGSPTNTTALLLAADANTYVRFLPNADFSGSVSPGITFRAWDQTSGSAGGTADTSSNGGTTAFSTANSSANITVDQPLTVTGTATTSIDDNQTTNPFNGVTIGDSISAAENITVTVTQGSTANGALSNLGGFTDNNDGTFTFTGTAAAATTALQGILFTPTAHQVAPASTVDTTLTILAADSVTSTTDSSSVVHVTATNTAPTLTGANDLTSIHENDTNSSGTLVSDLIAGKASDPDFGQTLGIAITAKDETNGTWEYTTDAGAKWQSVGSVGNTHALLLAGDANTRVRFVPNAGFSGPVIDRLTFRAWDGFKGTAGRNGNTNSNGGSTEFSSTTASSTILINDAPTLTGANDLTTINENNTTSAGALVSALISGKANDVNGNSLGIAITGVDNTNGTWQFTTNGGTNWTDIGSPTAGAALLLAGDANTRVRFVPAADFFGTSSITFQAWDETSGAATGTGDATVNGGTTAFSAGSASASIRVNAPPTISGTVAGQATTDAAAINPFSTVVISDPDSPAQTLTVTVQIGTPANGQFTTASLTGWTTVTPGSTYSFTGTAAAATTAIRALVFQPTNHQVVPGSSVTTGFTITANDTIANTASDSTTTVVATPINNPPTIVGTVSNQAVNDNATISPFSGVIFSDSDNSAEPATVTVTLDTPANGQFTAASTAGWTVDVAGGVYSFSGTRAQAQAAIQALVFQPTSQEGLPGSTFTTHFTIDLTDGANSASDNTTSVIATAFNNPPTINGTQANQPVNDNATIAPFSGVTISDADPSTEPASVTVTIDHPANGQFTAASTTGWTVNIAAGTYTFSGTRAQVESALQVLVFQPTNHQVIPGNAVVTHFTIDLTDGSNTATDSNTSVIATAINNPPTIVGAVANQAVNDNATIQPFSGVTIVDADLSTEPAVITVSLDNAANGQFTAASTVGWVVNVGAGTYTFAGTRAAAQAALEALVFAPTNHQVVPGATVTTVFTIQLTDGAHSASDSTTSVVATAINNPPTIVGTMANQAVNDNATIAPFSGVSISDPDNSDEPATLTVTLDTPANGQFTAASTAGWTVDIAGGVYSFSGTRAQAQAALQALVFRPTNHEGIPGSTFTTHFTIDLVDGGNSTSDANTSVIATAFNNPPTIVGTVANQATTDDTSIAPFSGVTISDPDLSTEPATITVTLDNAANGQFTAASTVGWTVDVAGGTYTFSGTRAHAEAALQALVFTPTNHQVVPSATVTTHFTISLDDGPNNQTDANTSVIATAVNNPPTIVGAVANQAVNDNATITPFSGVTISDPDNSAEPATITVTLDHPENGQFTAASTAGWTVNVAGGTYTYTGTRAQAQAALEALVFAPTNHQVIPGATVATVFTIQLDDGGNLASDANTSVIATAINNPPTILGSVANQAVGDNATISPFAGVTLSDPDNSDEPATITVMLDHPENGQFTTASTVGWTVNVAGGTYTFSGTRAQAQAALEALVFAPTNHQVTPGATVTTVFTIQLDDGGNLASDANSSVVATAINDAPSLNPALAQPLTTITEDQTTSAGNTVASILGLAVSDVDFSPLQGIAITDTTVSGNGQGVWQYSIDGGTSWSDIGAVSDGSALLLRSTDLVRFLPDAKNGNTGTITFRAWDQTGQTFGQEGMKVDASSNGGATPFSTAQGTSAITVQDVNDAPVLTPAQVQSFTTITEDDVTNAGSAVATLLGTAVSDVDFGAVQGIAVTDATVTGHGLGRWQFSTDGGANWSDIGSVSDTSALLLRSTDRVRFLPDAKNGDTGTITFRAWDQSGATAGQQGTKADTSTNGLIAPFSTAKGTSAVTVLDVNDAPVLDSARVQPFTAITEDDIANSGSTVASLLGAAATDVDFGAVQGIAITSTTVSGYGQGHWQYSINGGTSWSDIGIVSDSSALLLRPTDLVRFLPDAKNGNVATISFRAWDQTGMQLDTSTNGGVSPFSAATATVNLTIQDVNDAPLLTPESFFLPVTVSNSTGAANGTVVGGLPSSDVDLPAVPFAWAITSGNNGAFTINPTTGAISVANTSQFAYTGMPIVLGLTATENQFTSSAPAVGRQSLTIVPWMVTTSATQINGQRITTLTINLLSADPAQLFTGTISWNDGTSANVTLTPGQPLIMQHQYLTNPDAHNAAAPIQINLTVRPADDPAAVSATASTAAPVPGNGLANVKVEQTTTTGFVEAAQPIILDAPIQTTTPLSSVSQTTAAGASTSESINTDERLVALRLVSPSEAEAKDVVLSDPKVLAGMIGENRAFKMNDTDLDDLPALFKKLPDGRYQVYLAEEGHLRLVIDVVVRQGRAVDPTDDSGGRDRPPTGQIEVGHRDPIVEIKAQFQRAVNGQKTDVPGAQPIDSSFEPDQPNWLVVPTGPAEAAVAARANSPVSRVDRPSNNRAPSRQSSADTNDKNHWTTPAAAAGAALAIGAGAVLSREERIDQAMQQLDPRSLSKGARLVRWLKRNS